MSRRLVVAVVSAVTALSVLLIATAVSATTTHFVNNGVACSDSTVDSSVTPYCTIQAAVEGAGDSDTIQIAAGTYTASSGTFVVDISGKDLILQGVPNGTRIDGESTRGGVRSTGGSLVLRDLIITNASTFSSGGGVSFDGGDSLTIQDVSLTTNRSFSSGGGLYFNGNETTITLTRVIASGNSASYPDNAIDPNGGAIDGLGNDVTLTIEDSIFSDNAAEGLGGAIVAGSGVTVTITNSQFSDNRAGTHGGAIVSTSEAGGHITITDSVFSGNEAAGSGGAIEINAAPLTVSRSLFVENTAGAAGGAIDDGSNENGAFTNVTVIGNTATGNNGGGIRTSGEITNSTIVGNHSGQSGGGVATSGWAGGPVVRSSIIADNTATDAPDCYSIVSGGHNMIEDASGCIDSGDTTGNLTGVDPMLLPLADNGGPTQTMALASNSPARNAGHPGVPGSGGSACAELDQRGFTRVPDGDCDMGAYEYYECNAKAANIVGTDGPDVIVGTMGDDVIVASGGDDTITGRLGKDTICGGAGNDDINGNDGNDWIFGEGGHDTLRGSKGNDRLDGGSGNDTIYGGVGKDKEWGGSGDDTLFGNKGRDTLNGGPGTDTIDGGPGIDTCTTGEILISC